MSKELVALIKEWNLLRKYGYEKMAATVDKKIVAYFKKNNIPYNPNWRRA